MFVAKNLLEALATIIDYALWAYMWAFILRAVLSWSARTRPTRSSAASTR